MYLSNFISSRHYNIKSSLSTEIAQNGEFCPNSAGAVKSRTGNGNAAERGVDIMAANQSLGEKGQRFAPNWLRLYITVETIR